MKFLIINCHPDNRGDEAAIHALVDELNQKYPECTITLLIRGSGTPYPNMPSNVKMMHQFIPASGKSKFAHEIAVLSKGSISLSGGEKELINEISSSDIVIHAPGGPCIGDTYYNDEPTYLKIFDLVQKMKKPYMFYAPSMGPFNNSERNEWRKRILNGAEAIALRDPISADKVRALLPEKTIYQTLDSALQHDIDMSENEKKLTGYEELEHFLDSHDKCIGITITDLLWHPVHSKDQKTVDNIKSTFTEVIKELTNSHYGIVFIPQLYGMGNDYNLMKSYCLNDKDFFVIPDNDERYDTYFQQYVISRLYAVIGMRYHSNIFSAKMGTPFISVSYEQKMQGFMDKMKLSDYCIALGDLNEHKLIEKFRLLEDHYDEYKQYLVDIHNDMKAESYKTTEILSDVLKRIG